MSSNTIASQLVSAGTPAHSSDVPIFGSRTRPQGQRVFRMGQSTQMTARRFRVKLGSAFARILWRGQASF